MADKNYLHTAYANSADGTDGFTTVYPNLNLLKNTKSQSYTSTGTDRNVLANIYKLDGSTSDVIGKNVTITYDFAITNSIGTWSGTINPTLGFGGSGKPVSNTSLSGSVKQTISITSLSGDSYSIAVIGLPAGTKVTIRNLKVELGSTATPYMPSASEVTTADWPKYVGTYVDTNPASSTDPNKYDWDEMKYRVYLDGTPVGGSKLLSFDLENLKAGTTYNVQVNQINGNDESDKSESVAFKTTLTK
ncbi:hypothetical protein LMG8526HA_01983 [Lactococcus lactis]|nr:hypothetical protein [Lactococcus lactis]KSU10812.1 Phage capsid and scaffold [Lactococcus lactis subsp. lactis]MDU0401097.1 hypothetical protein [Lactococcus lactis]